MNTLNTGLTILLLTFLIGLGAIRNSHRTYKQCSQCQKRKPDVRSRNFGYGMTLNACDYCTGV